MWYPYHQWVIYAHYNRPPWITHQMTEDGAIAESPTLMAPRNCPLRYCVSQMKGRTSFIRQNGCQMHGTTISSLKAKNAIFIYTGWKTLETIWWCVYCAIKLGRVCTSKAKSKKTHSIVRPNLIYRRQASLNFNGVHIRRVLFCLSAWISACNTWTPYFRPLSKTSVTI